MAFFFLFMLQHKSEWEIIIVCTLDIILLFYLYIDGCINPFQLFVSTRCFQLFKMNVLICTPLYQNSESVYVCVLFNVKRLKCLYVYLCCFYRNYSFNKVHFYTVIETECVCVCVCVCARARAHAYIHTRMFPQISFSFTQLWNKRQNRPSPKFCFACLFYAKYINVTYNLNTVHSHFDLSIYVSFQTRESALVTNINPTGS